MADDDLASIVARAITEARDKGLDHIGQTEHAVGAVLAVRPDMTASDALEAVNRLRSGKEGPAGAAHCALGKSVVTFVWVERTGISRQRSRAKDHRPRARSAP